MDISYYSSLVWDTVTIEFTLKFLVVYFFVVWIFLVLWVARDISYRSSSLGFQLFCVFLMLISTPIGVLMYLVIRPKKNLLQQYDEEIEGNLGVLEHIISDRIESYAQREQVFCPECTHCVEPNFNLCPNCETLLKESCDYCGENIRKTWKVCPYCMASQDQDSEENITKKKKKKK